MSNYTINDVESNAVRKSLIKWGEIHICNQNINGVLKIKNYRKYQFRDEVDISFEGEIFVRIHNENRQWYNISTILNHKGYNISKVKLNRFLRRNSVKEIQIRMNYFGVNLGDYKNINKINWS